jgi:hypothetical protein
MILFIGLILIYVVKVMISSLMIALSAILFPSTTQAQTYYFSAHPRNIICKTGTSNGKQGSSSGAFMP